jgi:hypothetical protein
MLINIYSKIYETTVRIKKIKNKKKKEKKRKSVPSIVQLATGGIVFWGADGVAGIAEDSAGFWGEPEPFPWSPITSIDFNGI